MLAPLGFVHPGTQRFSHSRTSVRGRVGTQETSWCLGFQGRFCLADRDLKTSYFVKFVFGSERGNQSLFGFDS